MINHCLFLDPYDSKPELNCFNHLVGLFPEISFYYYQPSKFDLQQLIIDTPIQSMIIIGSSTHVSQNLVWHKKLANFTDQKLKQNIPVLGICFGHQLMAHYYGSQVEFIDQDEKKVIGIRKTKINEKNFQFGVTHRQIVKKLSDQFEKIDHNQIMDNDIIRHKKLPFIGIQPHPEASRSFLLNDCEVKPEEVNACQNSGAEFIRLFFNGELFRIQPIP